MHFRYMYGNVGAQSAFAPPSIARCAQKMNHPARFRARCSGKPPHNLLYWTKSPAGPAGTGKELERYENWFLGTRGHRGGRVCLHRPGSAARLCTETGQNAP